MIAAQLLAYYFTELKDDQVKKVSPAGAALATVLHSRIHRLHPPPASPRRHLVGLQGAGDRPRAGIHLGIVGLRACLCFEELGGLLKTPLPPPTAGLHPAVSLKRTTDVRWVPALSAGLGPGWVGDQRACLEGLF